MKGILVSLTLLLPLSFAQDLELSSHAFNLSRQLRCPVCTSESVADSGAEMANEMRLQIEAQLKEGKSDAEVLAYFQKRYGDWILLEPPKRGLHLLVWFLPLAAAATGSVILTLVFRRWLRRSRIPIEADAHDLQRVHEALEANS